MNGHWLARPMLRERATFLRVALAAVMINLFGLASSLFSMTVYDRVVPHAAFASLFALTIGLGVVVLFDFLLRVLRGWFVDQAGAQIDRAVAEEAFARLVAMRLSERKGSTGATAGILRELETLRDFFASATLTALVDLPFMLLTLIVVAMIGGWIVMVPIVVIPLVTASALAARPVIERGSREALAQGLSKQTILVETIGAIETVKANGAGPMLARRWLTATDQQAVTAMRQRLISNLAVTVSVSANSIVYAGVIVAGVFMVADRALTTGGLIACSMLAGRAIAPLGQIATLLARLASTRAAYRQIDAMMRQPTEGPAANAIAPATIRGALEFREVEFTYPGAAERTLDRLTLSIQPGEHVAVVGRVGSGKSTLARLALGLHEPQAGMVLVDGIDVRQFDPQALRAAMGVALQEAALFSGSVRENIVLDRAHVDEDEMRRAARVSGADTFLQSMTNGYDLRLADRGEGLSGGQRQAVGLARALAGRPPLLILDEPTSAMDGQSEAALLERLRAEIEGRTFLCITHRPALLALAKRVVVIERGRLVEDGPRDAILAKLNRPRAA